MKTYNLDQIREIPIYDFLAGWNRKTISKDFMYENCPFCSHKWHFAVSKNGRYFHSHNSCCKGGSIFDYVSLTHNLSFHESVKWLSNKYNIQGDSIQKISKAEAEKNKKISAMEELREREMVNDFFAFLKEKEYDKTFFKVLNWNESRIIHYIYDLVAAGAYQIS
jgi:DNA primase